MNGNSGRSQKSYSPSCQKIILRHETPAPHSPLLFRNNAAPSGKTLNLSRGTSSSALRGIWHGIHSIKTQHHSVPPPDASPVTGNKQEAEELPRPRFKTSAVSFTGDRGCRFPPCGMLRGRTIFLFPASRPSPPAPCQINRGSPSIEQSCHKQDRSSSVPSPGSAYIPTGHFRIPSRHAAQRAFTMRHGNRNRQRIHPVRANCQSHEGGRQQQAGQNSPYRQPYFPDYPAITA